LTVRLRSASFSLKDRPYLDAVYRAQGRNLVIRASRQVEKSTYLSNRMIYDVCQHPGLQILFVCPRHEQSSLFSNTRLKPVIQQSPVIHRLLWQSKRRIPVHDIEFKNGSRIYIRAAFHSADACRGISADELFIDEFQDLAPGSLPVLQETLSHSSHGRTILTGTPKMIDNHLETAFRASTACEWHVPCPHCERSFLLDERTLGPGRLICPQCQGPLVAASGHWVARNASSNWGDGFTICHMMVPWLDVEHILDKQRTYDRARFVNEVLGLPTALGDHVISRQEAEDCCGDYPFAQDRSDVPVAGRPLLVAGIDWGGGSMSGTVLVIGHMVGHLQFRVLRFERWLPHTDPNNVLDEVVKRCRQFQVPWIAADGGGNGNVYNRLLIKQLQVGERRPSLYSIYYSNQTQRPVIDGGLTRWTVDRTKSIGSLFSRIKAKQLTFPRVADSGSFLDEFICELFEFDEEMRVGTYTKPDGVRDDALHATNYTQLLGLYLATEQAAYA
jgi:hypothetical protein